MNQPVIYRYICPSISSCRPYEVDLEPGIYRFEAWGAQGGCVSTTGIPPGGKGGYTAGDITIKERTKLYIYVGSRGSSYPNIDEYAYNGGGKAVTSGGGGGATDFRLINDSLNETQSLESRILVAGGGGGTDTHYSAIYMGGAGGGIIAESGVQGGTGGTQDSGGVGYASGSFGKGGSPINANTCGGGGGYYGGGTGYIIDAGTGGGGGSSYISGHPECKKHYSDYVFRNIVLLNGNSDKGKSGDGEARITFIMKIHTCAQRTYSIINVVFFTMIILL